MQNRMVPRHITTLIKEINGRIEHPELKMNLSAAVTKLTLADLITPYSSKGETHSMAEWIALSGNQSVLTWIYKRLDQDLATNIYLLHAAVVCGQSKKIIEKLVKFENMKAAADLPNAMKFNGYTPLHLAVLVNNNTVTTMLEEAARKTSAEIKCIGSVHEANEEGETPFSLAAANGNLELISGWMTTIDRDHLPAPQTEKSIRTGLRNAIRAGHDDVADVIIARLHSKILDKECMDAPGTAITVAAEYHRQHALQALSSNLICAYIGNRNAQAKKYLNSYNFLIFKAEFGYPDVEKIPAAQALLSVVLGNTPRDTLAAHKGPLSTGDLKDIYAIVTKHYLDVYLPVEDKKACATKRS